MRERLGGDVYAGRVASIALTLARKGETDMGDTADYLENNPWDDPELMGDRFAEWRAMYGWQDKLDKERDPKKRRKLMARAQAEYMGEIESAEIMLAHGWRE